MSLKEDFLRRRTFPLVGAEVLMLIFGKQLLCSTLLSRLALNKNSDSRVKQHQKQQQLNSVAVATQTDGTLRALKRRFYFENLSFSL